MIFIKFRLNSENWRSVKFSNVFCLKNVFSILKFFLNWYNFGFFKNEKRIQIVNFVEKK